MSQQKKKKKSRARSNAVILILILCLMITACQAAEKNAGTGESTLQKTEGSMPGGEIIKRAISVEKTALGESFDEVRGMSACADGFVVAGEKDGMPVIEKYSFDGTPSDLSDITPPAGTDQIMCIGESADGGFCVLFSSSQTGGCLWCRYDAQGREQESMAVPRPEDAYLGAKGLPDGRALIWDVFSMILVHGDGSTTPVQIPAGTEITAVERLADGAVFAILFDGMNFLMSPVDVSAATLGEAKQCGSGNMGYGIDISGNLLTPYFHTGQELRQLDRDKAAVISTLGWTGAGLMGEVLYSVVIQNESTLIALSGGIPTQEASCYIVSIEDVQVTERKTLTVGVMQSHWSNIEAFVDYFNTTNKEYVAQIRYYDEPMQLAADLTSGNAPDVLEMTNVAVPLNDIIFMDMAQMMRSTPLVTEGDFVESIYRSMQINGKTLFLADHISVTTATARTIDVGEESGWTMDEFQQLMAEKGEGYAAFPTWLPPVEMLHWISFNAQGEYIDYETHTCNFENEAFMEQLALCKNQPDETSAFISLSDYDDHILLHNEIISDPIRVGVIRRNYGVHEYTFIGFPNNRGENGSFFSRTGLSTMLAIPATAPDPVGAWQFVSTMFHEAWQLKGDGLPVIREHLEKELQAARANTSLEFLQEDHDRLMSLINETNDYAYTDSAIGRIIEEEAQAYFADAIDAAEAAARIQNRVTLYLEERK